MVGTTHTTPEVEATGDGAPVRRSVRTRSTTYKTIGQGDGYLTYFLRVRPVGGPPPWWTALPVLR
jgi:hypothetical protein